MPSLVSNKTRIRKREEKKQLNVSQKVKSDKPIKLTRNAKLYLS